MTDVLSAAVQEACTGVSIASLNSQCFCISLSEDALRAELQSELAAST
jgi:hypothetical protein